MERKMPKDFYWGGSVSSFQTEGHRNEGGKGVCIYDVRPMNPEFSDWNDAIDEYTRYDEDIALMKGMGFNFYRFSICWSRIIPNGTLDEPVNEEGVKFYSDLIDKLLAAGIEPMITLVHFDMPYHLVKNYNGFASRYVVDCFERYAKVCIENFGDRVKYWLTINEQNMLTLVGPIIGTLRIPEGTTNVLKEVYQQNHHMLVAQAKAMVLCHEMLPNAKIGPAPNISYVYPATCKPEDNLAAQEYNAIRNWLYLDMAVYGKYNNLVWTYLEENDATPTFAEGDEEAMKNAHPDFIGFNYYSTATVQKAAADDELDPGADQQSARGEAGYYKGYANPNLKKTEFGWEIDPDGFLATMREMYSRYHLPMIVTENGLGAYDTLEDGRVHDNYRIAYLRAHIEQLHKAVTENIEMMGYCPWSAIDLVSTHEGIRKRYGFIYVDTTDEEVGTLDRYKKDSFYWYKKVIATNGEDLSDDFDVE